MASKNLIGCLIGVPIALVVLAVIIVGIIYYTDANSKQRTGTSQTETVNATPVSWMERRVRKNGYRVEYTFKTADGRTVSAVDERNTLYEPGFKFRVCYDPNNPTDSDLRHPTRGSQCGKGILF